MPVPASLVQEWLSKQDSTGCLIGPLMKRADVVAAHTAKVLMHQAGLGVHQCIFVLGFIQFMYWPGGISMCVGIMTVLLPIGNWSWSCPKVKAAMSLALRVCLLLLSHGVSHPSRTQHKYIRFHHAAKNPSVRRPGYMDWGDLLCDGDAWWAASGALSDYLNLSLIHI